MSQLRVFLSHTSQDKASADTIVQGLREAGADVWYDEHNLGAGHLKNEIQPELGRRPIFIVLLSKAAFASSWVKRETDWADELVDRDPTRLILPVTVGPIERADFNPEQGWLFLQSFRRIESPGYQPYPLPEAVRRLLQALALTPAGETSVPAAEPPPTDSVEDLLARGKALAAQTKYAEALPLYQHATKLAPRSFDAWANLGFAYGQIEQPSLAVRAYDRALAVDANQAWVWTNKGNALQSLQRYDEALAVYDQATTLDPNDAIAWRNKGLTLNDLKRYDKALAAFERSLTLESTSVRGWTGKAAALKGLGRRAEAEAAERQAKELGG